MTASQGHPVSSADLYAVHQRRWHLSRVVTIVWGVGGLVAIIGHAITRLLPIAGDSLSSNLGWQHWGVLLLNTLLMAYLEGYRGFQRGLAPRIAERAKLLTQHPSGVRLALAPAYCYGIISAPVREVIVRSAIILMIIGFIVAIRMLPAPWRGLLDVGVIVGLSWGIVAIVSRSYATLAQPR